MSGTNCTSSYMNDQDDPNGIFKSFLIDCGVGSSRFIKTAKLTSGTNVN